MWAARFPVFFRLPRAAAVSYTHLYIFNTFFITVLGTSGTVLIGSLAAFPLAKYRFPGSKFMSGVIVYSLMFNATAAGLVNYLTMSKLHMVDTYLAVTIPAIGSTFGVFLMRNFICLLYTSGFEKCTSPEAIKSVNFIKELVDKKLLVSELENSIYPPR